jgi:hypothetical protein
MLQAREHMVGQKAVCPVCHAEQVIPAEDEGMVPTAQTADEPEPSSRSGWDEDDRPRRDDDHSRRNPFQRRSVSRPASGPPTSNKAIAALVLGIFSFVGMLFLGIPALIFGFLSMRDVSNSKGKLVGWGLGLAGVILGSIGTFLVTPCVGWGVVWPLAALIREDSSKNVAQNDLKQVGVAMHNYHSAYNRFPGAAIRGPNGQPLLSWRVALLPYLGENALYQQFHLDEPWDSPANRPLVMKMPKVYAHPLDQASNQAGMTHCQVCVGPGTVFENPQGHKLTDILDGTSNTALVLEATNAVIWTKPDDLNFNPNGALPWLGGQFSNGFHVLMCDGSVRFASNTTNALTLRCLIQRNDGMPVWLP